MSFDSEVSFDETKLKQKATEMFSKTGDYLKAELEVTLEDYKLLEEMNKVTADRYKQMFDVCDNVSKSVDQINDKYQTLLPNLQLIDKIEEKVQKLENMAYAIDAYSKRLGIIVALAPILVLVANSHQKWKHWLRMRTISSYMTQLMTNTGKHVYCCAMISLILLTNTSQLFFKCLAKNCAKK